MRHRVRLAAEVHDRVRHAAGDVDEGEVAQLAIGTVEARRELRCELAEMTYPRFRQIAAESPGLVFELATQLATRLDRTNRKLSDLAFVDVTGRVAHAIMDLCGEPDAMTHPEGMQIKVSRQELSRLVGCSREMAGRVLKVLEDQGLLRATGKTIVVFNARPKMKTRPVVVHCLTSAIQMSAWRRYTRTEALP